MKLKELKKLQQEYVDARNNPLVDEDEYIYLDNKVLKLQQEIDSLQTPPAFDSETVWYLSVLFLTASFIAGFICIFVYIFAYVSIASFVIWVALAIYAVSIRNK